MVLDGVSTLGQTAQGCAVTRTVQVRANCKQRRLERVGATEVVDTREGDVVHGMPRRSIGSERFETMNRVVVGDAVEVDGESGETTGHGTIVEKVAMPRDWISQQPSWQLQRRSHLGASRYLRRVHNERNARSRLCRRHLFPLFGATSRWFVRERQPTLVR